ncbi:hypothetical protein ONZ45_g9225 [Pleurotus djamor]|nr:hypothetical protein ONZ45_g9225 [Pleurotus djamor]
MSLPEPRPKSHLFSAEHSKIVEAAWLKFLLLLDRLYSQEASTTLYRILLPLVHIAILYIQGEQHFERPSQPQQAKQNKKTQSTKPAVTHQHVRDAHKRKILKDMISSKKGNRKRYSA